MRKREVERYRHRLEALLAEVVDDERRAAGDIAGPDAEELPDPTDRATAEEVRARSVRLKRSRSKRPSPGRTLRWSVSSRRSSPVIAG